MPDGQAEEIVALALVFVVHVIGGAMLVWALLDDRQHRAWRRRWGWGGGPGDDDDRPMSPGPRGGGRAATLPLPPDAAPSRVRLRQPARVADGYPRPSRRPDHLPAPEPTPARRRPR